MISLFKKHKWLQVLLGVLLFVSGLITIIFAVKKNSDISTILSVCIAVLLFAFGITVLLSYFIEFKKSVLGIEIIYGSIFIACGIVFCLNVRLVGDIIVSLITSALLTVGAVFLLRGVFSCIFKDVAYRKVLSFVFGGIFLGLGVVSILFRDKTTDLCYLILGAFLAVLGILEISLAIKNAFEDLRSKKDVVIENNPQIEENNNKLIKK